MTIFVLINEIYWLERLEHNKKNRQNFVDSFMYSLILFSCLYIALVQ